MEGYVCMTIEEIIEVAQLIGIASASKFNSKDDLVKTIQLEMGLEGCFRDKTPEACQQRSKCMWAEDCPGEGGI